MLEPNTMSVVDNGGIGAENIGKSSKLVERGADMGLGAGFNVGFGVGLAVGLAVNGRSACTKMGALSTGPKAGGLATSGICAGVGAMGPTSGSSYEDAEGAYLLCVFFMDFPVRIQRNRQVSTSRRGCLWHK